MKKVLFFDCFSGISGDMTLGALIHLGVEPEALRRELDKLHFHEFDLKVNLAEKQGITGMSVVVDCHEHGSGHTHDHEHDHGHTHEQEHAHESGPRPHHHGHRSLKDIRHIIAESDLSDGVKARSIAIFEAIGRAEARVHGKELEDVCFHEVGAVDSIVDIVGTAICLELLGVEQVYCSPLHEGRGFIQCQHGTLPVPVPAVTELLVGSGITLITEDVPMEMVTPTGLGILRGSDALCGRMPEMAVEAVGWGFGKRDTGRLNALRVLMGAVEEEGPEEGRTILMEANLDDESGEILGYTLERLLEAGALDVWFQPIYMKKNRPAVRLSVLCREPDCRLLSDIILTETTTLGLRHWPVDRRTLDREILTVDTEWGPVRIKLAAFDALQKASPEYEDCARIARAQGIPLADVYSAAMAALSV